MATPEEIRSLALERVVAVLDAAWLHPIESPLVAGLDSDKPEYAAIIDEMARITSSIKAESASSPTQTMVWEAVCGGLATYSWWEGFEFSEGSDWDKPGVLTVTVEDPMRGPPITKQLTALDMFHAWQGLAVKTHCGTCDLIGDPDMCSSDLILQQAMLGEIVYG